MAENATIGGSGVLFVGEDKIIDFEVLDQDDVPVDIAGWAMTFDVRASDVESTALISASATVTGTYSATRASNTQRARVTLLDDTHMSVVSAQGYRYSLKRTTAGSETILAYGRFAPERATQI